MLSRYFGFQIEPFGAAPDPHSLFESNTHREALASLKYGFHTNRGFTAMIAQPGMGKTTLLFRFLDEIRTSARTVFLFDTQCKPRELIGEILLDLGIAPRHNRAEMHEQLKGVLTAEARAGRKFVMVIDEAQNLTYEALEMVRLLTNFETRQGKLIQVVLSGQPGLSKILMKASLEQLRQRISTFCRVESFSNREVIEYIEHHISRSSYTGAPLFTSEALTLIAETSRGIPRNINNLCFNALSLCCALRRKQVDAGMISEAIADQQLISSSKETTAVTRLKDIAMEYRGSASESDAAQLLPSSNPIEVTVGPNQALQGIGIKYLGSFDFRNSLAQ